MGPTKSPTSTALIGNPPGKITDRANPKTRAINMTAPSAIVAVFKTLGIRSCRSASAAAGPRERRLVYIMNVVRIPVSISANPAAMSTGLN
jgi:hypothetical protein